MTAFIPPHYPTEGRVLQGLAGEGVAVDEDGNVFVAEGLASRPFAVGGLTKYERAPDWFPPLVPRCTAIASKDPGDATPFSTRHPLSAIALRVVAGDSWLAAGQSE